MAKKKNSLRTKQGPSPKEDPAQDLPRSRDLTDEPDVKDALMSLYKDVEKGFDDQMGRANEVLDNWDLYNSELTSKQFYNGNSKIFVPLVHDAVNARVVRFTNQLFPASGKHAGVTTEDGVIPNGLLALLNHYVKKTSLRTAIVPALVRNGDIEGQYTIYCDWRKTERSVVWRTTTKPELEEGVEDPDEEIEDIEEDEIVHDAPTVEIISDPDFLVLPATANSLEQALDDGGSVTIIRRWTKAKIEKLIADGEIEEDVGKGLLKQMGDMPSNQKKDTAKEMVDAAGIKSDGRGKHALVYETWHKLFIDNKSRICRTYFAGRDQILSCRRNPFWADKLPIISEPVEKVAGSFKGRPKVSMVADMQIQANDAINEAMDSAAYALMPIVMTDPEKNPRVGSMILSLAAIWEANPGSTQFVNMPALWKDGLEIVGFAKQQIFQTMTVNPSQITQASGKKKMNQAEMAQEQQVDILTTSDAATVLEDGVLTPMLARWVEMDHQFRDEDVTVAQYGVMGVRAKMERIKPIQFNRRWQFEWMGVKGTKSQQMMQQKIAALNVLRGLPPQLYEGHKMNFVPLVTQIVEDMFGPELAPLIFEDMRSQLSQDPEQENELMLQGLDMPVHPLDKHQEHMQAHIRAMKESGGDPSGAIRIHLMKHQQMMAQAAAAAAQQQQGQPGAPGGAGPGVAGQPRPGAQPMPPRGGQAPPGAIHADQMRDPSLMPRRAG